MSASRRSIVIGLALLGAGMIFVMTVTRPDIQDFAVLTVYWLLLAGSWNLLAGFGGQFSFAHVALALMGGYLSVLFERKLGMPPAATLPLAGLSTALVGFGLGLVSLRVRGVYLSLITFGFAGALVVWATADSDHTRGYAGLNADILFTGIDTQPFLWLGLALVAVYFACQSLLLTSSVGLQAMAVRDREDVAEGLGVRTGRIKIGMFVYTAFWAGVAGSYYAGYVGIVSPSVGQLIWMGWVIAMVVVGGLGTALGPIAGVLLIRLFDFEVRSTGSEYESVMIAILLIVFMLFVPNGLAGLAAAGRARFGRQTERWVVAGTPAEPGPIAQAKDHGRDAAPSVLPDKES